MCDGQGKGATLKIALAAAAVLLMSSLAVGSDRPESVGELARAILQAAFQPPWVLVPELWAIVGDLVSRGNAYFFGIPVGFLRAGLFIFLIGGVHAASGSVLAGLGKGGNIEMLTSLGATWSLYGLFIWLSCLVVYLLGYLLR